jgi:aromatic ring-opening dioxygenase LigB subunit
MLNSQIVFAAISPHAPILLPNIGSKEDHEQVKKTIESLNFLGEKLKKAKPDLIIISSPHPDWGFEVPLQFIAKDFLSRQEADKGKIEKVLMGVESPQFYFEKGKEAYIKYDIQNTKYKVGLIASGDLSHCLKEDGPYGFQPDGPKFDENLVELLKKKDIESILKLDELYPEAGECGLRSFCFILGMLKESKIDYKPEILSYEGPFGVGYLTAELKVP